MSHGDYKAFFAAACAGDVELVGHHLGQGVDVDFTTRSSVDGIGSGPSSEGRADVALLLLDRGADPRRSDSPSRGRDPLQAAVRPA